MALLRRRRRAGLFAAAAVPVLALLALSAGPAAAAPPPYSSTTKYVAMGDSFAAGVGAQTSDLTCGRSPQGYPALWAKAHGIPSFTDVTCGGAVTGDVLSKQVSALSAQTDVVTITIGGNDAAWGADVVTCLTGGDQACAQAADKAKANQPALMAKIDTTYAAIRQAAPNAQVYVVGYPTCSRAPRRASASAS